MIERETDEKVVGDISYIKGNGATMFITNTKLAPAGCRRADRLPEKPRLSAESGNSEIRLAEDHVRWKPLLRPPLHLPTFHL
jgi:hypothetical protein